MWPDSISASHFTRELDLWRALQALGHVAIWKFSAAIVLVTVAMQSGMVCSEVVVEADAPVVRDMDATQLIGTYENVELPTESESRCADFIRIGRVEPLQSDGGVLYVLPHSFISLPQAGGGVAECEASAVDSPFTPQSATILRRDDQITLDRDNPLINAFALANERFFLGVEVGDRVCGLTTVLDGSPSMWMAPEQLISAPSGPGGFIIRFMPGRKYAFYFDAENPCVFAGDAREVGVPTAARSPTPSVTSVPSATPGSSPSPSASLSPGAQQATASPFISPANSIPISQVPALGSRSVCFPANAMVTLPDSRLCRMSDLRVGTTVATIEHHACTVIGFTHQIRTVQSWMIRLYLETNQTLDASPAHYVYVLQRKRWQETSSAEPLQIVRADDVRVGDRLLNVNRNAVHVAHVELVLANGLYNPQTTCGDLIVNGLLVTTYTGAVGSPITGHALMTAWRAVDRMMPSVGFVDWTRCSLAPGSYGICAR